LRDGEIAEFDGYVVAATDKFRVKEHNRTAENQYILAMLSHGAVE